MARRVGRGHEGGDVPDSAQPDAVGVRSDEGEGERGAPGTAHPFVQQPEQG
ncbi:hypothetical protein GA0115246_1021312, partial [Streptomyces sp. SolWspMP-sol7th]